MEPTISGVEQCNEKLGDNCSNTRRETAITIIPDENQAEGTSVFTSDSTSTSRNNSDETINDVIEMSANKKGPDDIKREIDTPFDGSDPDKHQNVLNQSVGAKLTGVNYSDPIGTNVYLLKAKKNSDSANLRWFEISQSDPTELPPDHKVIILMGATGSGKSTLVNGMVNYILGVKWNDPFRFKCIRENESESRNQAHSQTSSVTAYTIHHQKGMVIPYSITIIDTPGYGDTRGIERDKEITKLIHEFLMMQPDDSKINRIHAACFVAASGDSRLTVTQRYIIDSVLSIFGKDFKDNIRLLVTFADNADPPVVEACRAAQFPVTSQSAGVVYSKFNSSVLYAPNEQGEDDSSFDQLFWDMGQENFEKFFTMLEGMNGKDLISTREVIQQRTLLEQSLNEIELQLEVCFVKIEKMRNFGRKPDKNCVNELVQTKVKLMQLLEQVDTTAHSLDSTALRSNALSPADYLSLMRSRVAEEQKPGYLTRLETLTELQQSFSITETEPSSPSTIINMKGDYDGSFSLPADGTPIVKGPEQVDTTGRSLDSTALRSNTLGSVDYHSLMRSRVAEGQKPGNPTRLETLTEPPRSLFTVVNMDETCDGSLMSKQAQLSVNAGWLAFLRELLEKILQQYITRPLCRSRNSGQVNSSALNVEKDDQGFEHSEKKMYSMQRDS